MENTINEFIKLLNQKMATECLKFHEANGYDMNNGRTFTIREILDYCYKAEKEVLNKYDLAND